MVRDKVGRPPGELGVSKSMECDIFLQCFDAVGWATGRPSSLLKKLDIGLLVVMI